jgi:hypothetical protein
VDHVLGDGQGEEDRPEYMRGRQVVDNELEDVIPMRPFQTVRLFTGQQNAALFGERHREVGQFKGLVRITRDRNAPGELNVNEVLAPKKLFARLYALRGTRLMATDLNGKADPYLVVKVGKQKFTTRDRYVKESLEPEFFESFEVPVEIPGDSHMEVEVWDYDGIGDDLIGRTVIDLEDRWFSKSWRKLAKKPVEFRTLKSPTSTAPQGKLELYLDILPAADARRVPMDNIKPPPPDPFEIRVIIWGVRDVTIKDTITEQNDLYVTCQCSFPGLKMQETDTHLRSKKGKGNFNWRMKFPVTLPMKPRGSWPRLRFQIWDKDFFSPNDSICEAVVSLKGLCQQALKRKDRVKLLVDGKERFWLDNLRHPNEAKTQGRMEISVEIMPQSMANTQLPAGFGRSDPNTNPFLPPPEGRVKWSLFHPLDMLREILGDRLYYKLCGILCVLTVLAACGFTAPMIFSNLVSKALVD